MKRKPSQPAGASYARLLEQVRSLLAHRKDVQEQRSIGGSISFTVAGNMVGAVGRNGLMVRVGPARYEWALAQPHIAPLAMGGKRPVGYVMVGEAALAGDGALEDWLAQGLAFVLTLPPKHTARRTQ